jgi:hypothetical protein
MNVDQYAIKELQMIYNWDHIDVSNSEVRKYTVSNTSYTSDMLMGTLKHPS